MMARQGTPGLWTSLLPARWLHRKQTLPPLEWDWWLIRQQPESQRPIHYTLIGQPIAIPAMFST